MEMYAGFGKNVYTAFATIGGNAVGVVATGKELCHNCVAKLPASSACATHSASPC